MSYKETLGCSHSNHLGESFIFSALAYKEITQSLWASCSEAWVALWALLDMQHAPTSAMALIITWAETKGRRSPKNMSWGDGPCIRPPNIWRSSIGEVVLLETCESANRKKTEIFVMWHGRLSSRKERYVINQMSSFRLLKYTKDRTPAVTAATGVRQSDTGKRPEKRSMTKKGKKIVRNFGR